ncbi:MAG: hypothetical protein NT018_11400 [Armatimonadetes bacterium]|nr:hypothetical protein [Armatimonadota bacterium]
MEPDQTSKEVAESKEMIRTKLESLDKEMRSDIKDKDISHYQMYEKEIDELVSSATRFGLTPPPERTKPLAKMDKASLAGVTPAQQIAFSSLHSFVHLWLCKLKTSDMNLGIRRKNN